MSESHSASDKHHLRLRRLLPLVLHRIAGRAAHNQATSPARLSAIPAMRFSSAPLLSVLLRGAATGTFRHQSGTSVCIPVVSCLQRTRGKAAARDARHTMRGLMRNAAIDAIPWINGWLRDAKIANNCLTICIQISPDVCACSSMPASCFPSAIPKRVVRAS